ncbi:hypothetical protein LCGC14_2961170, partial [marine sediment metagenome]
MRLCRRSCHNEEGCRVKQYHDALREVLDQGVTS